MSRVKQPKSHKVQNQAQRPRKSNKHDEVEATKRPRGRPPTRKGTARSKAESFTPKVLPPPISRRPTKIHQSPPPLPAPTSLPQKPLPSFGFPSTSPSAIRDSEPSDIIAAANLYERNRFGIYDLKLQHARSFLRDPSAVSSTGFAERCAASANFLVEVERVGDQEGIVYDREVWLEVNGYLLGYISTPARQMSPSPTTRTSMQPKAPNPTPSIQTHTPTRDPSANITTPEPYRHESRHQSLNTLLALPHSTPHPPLQARLGSGTYMPNEILAFDPVRDLSPSSPPAPYNAAGPINPAIDNSSPFSSLFHDHNESSRTSKSSHSTSLGPKLAKGWKSEKSGRSIGRREKQRLAGGRFGADMRRANVMDKKTNLVHSVKSSALDIFGDTTVLEGMAGELVSRDLKAGDGDLDLDLDMEKGEGSDEDDDDLSSQHCLQLQQFALPRPAKKT